MKIKLLALSVFLLFTVFCGAQSAPSQIVSAQGGYAKSNDFSLEWTLGETIASTFTTFEHIYTQGFNQSYLFIGKKIRNSDAELVTVFAAPNPVQANLSVSVVTQKLGRYAIVITNFLGVKVYQQHYDNLSSQNLNINMRGFTNGSYLLQVFDMHNKIINTTKIIKL